MQPIIILIILADNDSKNEGGRFGQLLDRVEPQGGTVDARRFECPLAAKKADAAFMIEGYPNAAVHFADLNRAAKYSTNVSNGREPTY